MAFNGKPDAQLRLLIAIGLYSESESRWAETCTPAPRANQVRQYHQIAATPHSLKDIEDEVEIILKNFGAGLVDLYQKQQFSSVIKNVEEGLRKKPKEFFYGVAQATVGAVVYTVLLIAFSYLLKWGGIDLLDVFGRVSGK
jgi:hypothetical protein